MRSARWSRVIVGFVVALAAGAAVALVLEQSGGWAAGAPWEIRVLRAVHRPLPRWLDLLLVAVPWIGTNITIFGVGVPLWFWLRRHGQTAIAAELATAAVGSYLLNFLIKLAFERPRPMLWEHRGEYTWSSYPSGHAIAMMSVWLAAVLHLRRRAWWAVPLWGVLTAATLYSRLYLGVHWPGDVVGGVVIGVVWFVAVKLSQAPGG